MADTTPFDVVNDPFDVVYRTLNKYTALRCGASANKAMEIF